MAGELFRAILRIETRPGGESVVELASLTESLDSLVLAAIWGGLASHNVGDADIERVRELLQRLRSRPKATSRLFPSFARQDNFTPEEYDPFDPLDVAVQQGLNYWLKAVVRKADERLYQRIFSVASVERLEQHSPMVMEVALLIAAVPSITVLLIYSCLRAAAFSRKAEAEADIRETEADIKREELRQAKLKTKMLEHLSEGVADLRFPQLSAKIPPEVLQETARVAVSSVADLSGSPLIDKIEFSIKP